MLKFHRQMGDMIEVYKIFDGIYNKIVSPNIYISVESHTRGNLRNLVNCRWHYKFRKHSFCNRVTNSWNSLPKEIVTSPSVNCL